MDYNTLKYIITVDKYQSISKAAEELYLSQPNISKAIQNIEKEIGFSIFSRTSRGVTTTPEGKELIKKAHKIVNNFDDFAEEFSSKNKQIFSMNIAHPKDIFFQNKVIDMAEEFLDDDKLNINILEGSTEEIIDMILKETVNMGIICSNEHDLAYYKKLLILNGLEFKVNKPLKLKATIHKTNPLSKKKIIDKKELSTLTLITTNTNDHYKYYNEKYHIVLNNNVVKTTIGFNQLALLSKVHNSCLISLPISEKTLNLYDCKMIDLESGIGDWITITIYKKDTKLTKLEERFANIFQS